MRLRRSLAALLALLVSGAGDLAPAHDHRPPAVTLRFAGEPLQRGGVGTTTWVTYADENYAVIEHSDGTWEFPDTVSIPAVRTAAIRIRKTARPHAAMLEAWATGDHNRSALGPTTIEYRLIRRGHSAWDLRFDTGLPCRHFYLTLSAEWPDEQGTPYLQNGVWLFHYVTDLDVNGQRVTCTA